MNDVKFFIGPMSRNVTDAVIEMGDMFGFIPSRRQVDYDDSGYVNNWNTKTFAQYVDGRNVIERDHGGPGQGLTDDDGYRSFEADCENLDIIHIDPWKKYSRYVAIGECVRNLEFCHSLNKNIKFEVGTEAAIMEFTPQYLFNFLVDLELVLLPETFEAIEYVTIQSGVGLNLGKGVNTGKFDADNMQKMLDICKKFGKKSKEHNGDYLSDVEYKMRFDMGLDAINIAPEFGQIETLCYLEEMGNDIEDFYQICLNSGRWRKWVSDDFVPENNKREVIHICGHYVLSDEAFLAIKPDIDDKIKQAIKDKLTNLQKVLQ